ncbi:D-alanyl-D-alanine carboxypeptidase PBP3 [Streptococcus panodentis]|uniref:serine-type D-Ala-D-Ala carboxypeptidase n=1 Tax=Streptococcus panodentis TaxID=1581472 RepID=A0ABS5AXU2_9STRE|nr:D-alanyl-D-alanine carboxypeptidase PBP3 [Streptococcus panodentis]MBP2621350.1 D-alanyl-D-alanine carboxypeptidase [Streptococcus panodentis]
MKRFFLSIILLIALTAGKAAADDYNAAAKSAIAVDATSGKILYEKDSSSPIEVGSITNLLTVYLVYEAIDKGQLTADTYVDISDTAYHLSVGTDISNVPLEARRYKVKDLITASLVSSANGATLALAEKVGGSEENFVQMMKAKLKEWGIEDATIVNSTGLNTLLLEETAEEESSASTAAPQTQKSKDTENKFSAYDIAVISRHLILDYPQVTDITSKATVKFADMNLESYNFMLENQTNFRSGVDGLKTGGSDKGGSSFVASTSENGIRMITVVLGVEQTDGDPYARFVATAALMNYVSQNFTQTTIVAEGEAYNKSKATVIDGKQETVTAVASKDFTIVERISNQAEHKIEFSTDKKGFQAPLKKDTEVGTLTYTDPEPIGQGYLENKSPSVTMVAGNDVEKSIFFKVWWNDFVRYVNEKL